MSDYRRVYVPGGTYFFTVVTAGRRPWLQSPGALAALRHAMRATRYRRPFDTLAIVVLPDHLHTIWVLPENDHDFSIRWKTVKQRCTNALRRSGLQPPFWQPRFWEHLIRDETDLRRHVDYIHYNPVKHGCCAMAADWTASSFHRFVEDGVYPRDWGGPVDLIDIPE